MDGSPLITPLIIDDSGTPVGCHGGATGGCGAALILNAIAWVAVYPTTR
ncbi:hypothetical protein A8926_6857 [Saccharopolyspora spinosa]|uniref:Uncharacterized protein n=1 Tax=Saccharopolyspora spinosa TaxID=60894 RepID=A0A2N3Y779_SACSN|nr:hypothetical protein A8926_6857 [Saccharopolyspora spinosa]